MKLHICGNIEPLLPKIKDVGADIVDIDWMVDFKKAVDIFSETSSCACGNVDPVAIMQQSSAEQVKNAVRNCIEMGDEMTFIAAGCEIPRATPDENLKAMAEVL